MAPPAQAVEGEPVLVAVGDAVCDPDSEYFRDGAGTSTKCRHRAVSDRILSRDPSAVVLLGDAQYETAKFSEFFDSGAYDDTYGRFLGITKPALGNHEWKTAGAAGFFDYFGDPKPYYAWDPAPQYRTADGGPVWRAYVLDTTCHDGSPEGCKPSSAQLDWLKADLEANPAQCVLAAAHHPPFLRAARQPAERPPIHGRAVRGAC